MVDSKAINMVKGYMEKGDSLSVAIKKAASYFENKKIVETDLAKYFTVNWSSDFVE